VRSIYFPGTEAPDRRAPLWARLTGQRHRDSSYRYRWGEFDPKYRGFALELTGFEDDYGRATLIVAFLVGRFFIKLWRGSARFVPTFAPGETKQYGFSFAIAGSWSFELWLHLGKRVKICRRPWGWTGYRREYFTMTGVWLPCDQMPRTWHSPEVRETMGEEPWTASLPYHYMTDYGEAQHVNAAIKRERVFRTWSLFGIPLRRSLEQSIDVTFDEEVGSERGSWKGGCVGCSYEMEPGETPAMTLRRMQRERRFCR
jgi:hypothetical protein